ncbi:MAG TPA: hypothetical protein VF149_01910 [Bacillales bacterium]
MSAQQKQAFRWLVQGLIVAALVCFVLFVFFGPTSKGAESGISSFRKNKPEKRSSLLSFPVSFMEAEYVRANLPD